MNRIFIGLMSLFLMSNLANAGSAKMSWYGIGDGSGKHTANGERFNPYGMTVAHKRLPFGTKIRFTNPKTGRTVIARVNDRGPFVRGVEFDLTKGVANRLGMRGNMHMHYTILGR